MNIDEFTATIARKGTANQANFHVEIYGRGDHPSEADLRMRVENVSFPGRQVASVDRITYGPPEKVGYAALYGDVPCTILLSEDFGEKQYMQRWQDKCVGLARGTNEHKSGMFDVGFYDTYKGQVDLIQCNELGEEVYRCTLIEAWPSSVGELQGDWGTDALHKLPVSFSYRYYVDDPGWYQTRVGNLNVAAGLNPDGSDLAEGAGVTHDDPTPLGADVSSEQIAASGINEGDIVPGDLLF